MTKVLEIIKNYETKESFTLSHILEKFKSEKIDFNYDYYALSLKNYFSDGELSFNTDNFKTKKELLSFFQHLKAQLPKINNSVILARYYEILFKFENQTTNSPKDDNYRVKMIENLYLAINENKVINFLEIQIE